VLEGSLDLDISANKKKIILHSVSSAIVLFGIFVAIFSFILVNFLNYPLKSSIINVIPLGIISSAVAIPAASRLNKADKEFIVYESSVSDIVGILVFDFILFKYSSFGKGLAGFVFDILITLLLSIVFSAGLALLLHKITHHVKYVIITTVIILVFALAKLEHMPSLLVVFIFGLVMNNNHFFRNKFSEKVIDFENFNVELKAFKNITSELTFIVRSFFFIIFGFYTFMADLLNLNNLMLSITISLSIFVIRGLYFGIILQKPLNPLLFFAPRGLITILLFFSIPASHVLSFMNQGLITQVIFITILLMTFGSMIFHGRKEEIDVLH
jgi:Kef-type K+ transport system membrane component KefB